MSKIGGFDRMRKLTIEIVKERMKTINFNISILSDIYVNSSSYLKCKCLIDNFEWNASWNMLQSHKGCPKCARKNLTLGQLKKELKVINPNVEILSDTYINSKSYLQCKCVKDGHIWNITWNDLQHGYGCPVCSNNIRLTLEEVKERVKSQNSNIEILSDVYNNQNSILKYKCLIDGYIWESTIGNLVNGSNCPKCAIKNISNSNNWNWHGGISIINNVMRDFLTIWKKDSMRNSEYKCIITSDKFQHIHHLYSFNLIMQEVIATTNIPLKKYLTDYTTDEIKSIRDKCIELHDKYGLGICLNAKTHSLFHSLYGKGDNTKEQFIEFVSNFEEGIFKDFLKDNNLDLNINYKALKQMLNI